MNRRSVLILAGALALAFLSPPGRGGMARADDEGAEDDHDALREALERGEIMALSDLKQAVTARIKGDIIAVEAERKREGFVYEFKILTGNGHIVEVYVRARDGTILKVENE